MSEHWRRLRIGEVVSQKSRSERVVAGRDYRLLGVRWYGAGAFFRESVSSESSKATRLFPVEVGDFIYNRLFAWKGSFAIIDDQLAGCYVSGEFPLFTVDASLIDVRYLLLLMNRPTVWSRIEEESTGSTAVSRNRWKEERFLSTEISIPPVQQQLRVVDLIAAIDHHTRAADAVAAAARRALASLVAEWSSRNSAEVVRLGSLAHMGSGPSWKSADESNVATAGAVRVLGITNTPSGGGPISFGDAKFVSGLPQSTARLTTSSLLMIRTNGNRDRIGNVYLVPDEAVGCAFSAFQIGLHFDSPADAEFAYWMLTNPSVQRSISDSASGTTGLGNVGVGWLRNLELPWPREEGVRAEALSLFREVHHYVTAAMEVARRSSDARYSVLGSLLSGEHELSDSYDLVVGA